MSNPRENTVKLLEAVDNGEISWEVIATEALHWLSEDEVTDMIKHSDYLSYCLDDDGE